MIKKDPIQTYVPERKYLPEIIGASVSTAFCIGLMVSPVDTDYDKLSIVSNTNYETIYIEKQDKIPLKIVIPKIDENAYGSRSYGHSIRKLSLKDFRKFLKDKGFKNVDKADLYKLRRVWIAYNYESMLMNVHALTDFPVSMIYSFFIIEATSNGIETELWRLHANAGGVKHIKGHNFVTYRTREVIRGKNKYIRAKFFATDDTEEGIKVWASVLNSKRYAKCKKQNYRMSSKIRLYESICRCIYVSGYHTDSDYKFRASLMAEFWSIKAAHFPNEEN